MHSSCREDIVARFDELHAAVSELLEMSFDALTTPEQLALLERLERETRRLPVAGHALINQLGRQASETELGGKLPAAVQQQKQKERRTDKRGDDADRQLRGRGAGAREGIGDEQKNCAAAGRCRQQQTMARPNDQPQQVRDDDADESDHARYRNGGAGGRGDQDDQRPLESFDRDTEMKRFGFAEREQVEVSSYHRK